jgi:hypothetical protein
MNVNSILRKLGANETTKTEVKVTRNGNYLIQMGKFFEVYFTPSGEILQVEDLNPSRVTAWDWLTNIGIETTKIELTFTLPPVKVVRKIWRETIFHTETEWKDTEVGLYRIDWFYPNHGKGFFIEVLVH